MYSESQIQKKLTMICVNEFSFDEEKAQKAIWIAIEKMKELEPNLPTHEFIEKYLDKFECAPEAKNFFKDRLLSVDPGLDFEEGIREEVRIWKEFLQIEQKQH